MFYFLEIPEKLEDGPSTEHYLKWRAAQSQIDIAVAPFCSYVFTLLCSLFSLWAIVKISQMFLFSSCKICFYLAPLYMSTHYISCKGKNKILDCQTSVQCISVSTRHPHSFCILFLFSFLFFFEQYRIRIHTYLWTTVPLNTRSIDGHDPAPFQAIYQNESPLPTSPL